jgi:fluoride exporter
MNYVWISLGAIAGAISRYQIDAWLRPQIDSAFPWPTLLINVTGSFIIGLLANSLGQDNTMRLLLMVGFCGAYTTFSTYSLEIIRLIQSGNVATAMTYLALSALVAPLGCYLGYTISR